MEYHLSKIEDIIKDLDSSEDGLSSDEASKRLEKFGNNEFKKPKPTPLIIRFFRQITDPMIIILLVAAGVSTFISITQDDSIADVIIILAVVLTNAILGLLQESKAEKSIEALKKMSASKSTVIRDGKRTKVLSEDIVPGDIVILEAGDAVPADGRIIKSESMKIEESALTGESVPVNKLIDVLNLKKRDEDVALADRKNMAYMGTTVVYGRGAMLVTSTGMQTEMGKIAGELEKAKDKKTPLQIKMVQLSKVLTWVVVTVCIVIFALQLIESKTIDEKFVVDSFMIAISLAVAAIPEGLPAVVTVSLSIGVSKMSKRNAIIRKLTAVETLGCAQIICSDKTGTLTQNKMTVTDYFSYDKEFLIKGMALCNDAKEENGKVEGEATEAALTTWSVNHGFDANTYERVLEIPFDSSRKMMSTLHIYNDKYLQCTKGAPDIVLKRCTKIIKNGKITDISEEDIQEIKNQNKIFTSKALRVLACAIRIYDNKPQTFDSKNNEIDLAFVGLTGMIDPIRPEVKDAIIECKNAGIKPIMITGDHIDTAKAIAKTLGILNEDEIALDGNSLDKLDDSEFSKQIKNISVYARVRPEHKSRIVNTWQNASYVVAMTGDGVNDAPSIKTADIGVGMGITGTDVTKNVADMVLADDNFASIVNAVEEGRRIYENILKSIQFLLSSNISEVLCVFIASIFGFVILLPVHLLLINMVTDCLPALALGLEDKEYNIMKRPPRDKKSGIFSNGVGKDIIYQGLIITALILTSFLFGVYYETGSIAMITSEHGMTMAFLTASMVGCFHSINMRSLRQSIFTIRSKNNLLFYSIIISILLLALICMIPILASFFSVAKISIIEWAISFILSILIIPIVEIVKLLQRKISKK